ncbi:MAG: hypothetical protein ACJAV5_002161 [Vicingaceae bacterium]|jgi:hypothetical protein
MKFEKEPPSNNYRQPRGNFLKIKLWVMISIAGSNPDTLLNVSLEAVFIKISKEP